MGFVVPFLLVLGAAPAIAPGSECAAELTASLASLDGTGVTVTVGSAPKHELSATRKAGQRVMRELGPGTCDEVARATAVVIERWLLSLAPGATPRLIPVPPVKRVDAGDAGRPAAMSVTFPAADAGNVTRMVDGDAGRPAAMSVTFPAADAGNVTRMVEPDAVSVTLPAPDAGNVTRIAEDPLLSAIGTAPPSLVVAPRRPPPARPVRIDLTRFEALVGGGLIFPSLGSPLSPAIAADLALSLNGWLRLSLVGLFDFGGTQSVLDERNQTRGQFTSRGGLVAPTVQLCLGEQWRVCGGALVGARIVEGTASGSFVFQATTLRTGAFVLGPEAHFAARFGAFEAVLSADLLVTPSTPTFVVTGLGDLAPISVVQGAVRLGLGFAK
ncbi:MAG: hypothetical protein U0228_22580 [Myxococcaceae bacterium]